MGDGEEAAAAHINTRCIIVVDLAAAVRFSAVLKGFARGAKKKRPLTCRLS